MRSARVRAVEELEPIEIPPHRVPDMPAFLAEMAQSHGPVLRRRLREPLPVIGDTVLYLVGPEANEFVLRSGRSHFGNEAGWTPLLGSFYGRGLLNMDGPDWTTARSSIAEFLKPAPLARYVPTIWKVVRERTATWRDGRPLDLYAELRKITFDVIAATVFDLPLGSFTDTLREHFHDQLRPSRRLEESPAETQARTEVSGRALRAVLAEIVTADTTRGVLQALRDGMGRGGRHMSTDEIVSHAAILFAAGHETATSLGSWILFFLGRTPETLRAVREEIAQVPASSLETIEGLRHLRLLGAVIEEVGRLRSPLRNVPRSVTSDAEFVGVRLPSGTHIRYAIGAGHMLPHVFPDPGRFDPSRFLRGPLPHPYAFALFGGGPRLCVGAALAQVELKAVIGHVAMSFDWEVPAGADPVQTGTIDAYPASGIPALVRRRASPSGRDRSRPPSGVHPVLATCREDLQATVAAPTSTSGGSVPPPSRGRHRTERTG